MMQQWVGTIAFSAHAGISSAMETSWRSSFDGSEWRLWLWFALVLGVCVLMPLYTAYAVATRLDPRRAGPVRTALTPVVALAYVGFAVATVALEDPFWTNPWSNGGLMMLFGVKGGMVGLLTSLPRGRRRRRASARSQASLVLLRAEVEQMKSDVAALEARDPSIAEHLEAHDELQALLLRLRRLEALRDGDAPD
ncbi:MAG: hypothetical protein AAFR54_12050 [Planctomycetota bacterium]